MTNTPKRKPVTKRQTSTRKKQADAPAPDHPEPSEEDIRRRAYELYEQRGATPGYEHDDWVRAERELRGAEAGPT